MFFENEVKNHPKKRKVSTDLGLGPVKKRIIKKKTLPKNKPKSSSSSRSSSPGRRRKLCKRINPH